MTDFIDKYLFWIKLAIAAAVIAIAIFAWNKHEASVFNAGHIAGAQEAQEGFDRIAKVADAKHAKEVQAARTDERNKAAAANKIDVDNLEKITNEKSALEKSVNFYRNQSHSMRTFTGKAIDVNNSFGVSGSSASPGINYAICEAQLPAEVGTAFEDLREAIVRIGSEADQTAVQLDHAQQLIRSDRK
ncbi:MAG TPA: hypothetical protein VGC12_00360 [Methyloradius sp.]